MNPSTVKAVVKALRSVRYDGTRDTEHFADSSSATKA